MNSKVNKNAIVGASIFCLFGLAAYYVLRKPKHKKQNRFLAISLGGTHAKICVLYQNPNAQIFTKIGEIRDIETNSPAEFVKYIKDNFDPSTFDYIAIASFGPLHLRKDNKYGQLIVAPSEQKVKWKGFSLAHELSVLFKKPAHVETDVNAAAIAEFKLGNFGKINSLAYITIGTGVGVGLVINGKTVHGFLHPEGGHTV